MAGVFVRLMIVLAWVLALTIRVNVGDVAICIFIVAGTACISSLVILHPVSHMLTAIITKRHTPALRDVGTIAPVRLYHDIVLLTHMIRH